MLWINDSQPFLVNAAITEYDIRQGNVSVMKTFQLAPDDTIKELMSLPKDERNVRVGLLMREDKSFSKALEKGFDDVVKQFIENNGLDLEEDVLAIRRDAVFVINRDIPQPNVGEYVTFRPKGVYHSYLQLNTKLEFFFAGDELPEVKGFVQAKNDINNALEKLKPGMFSFLKEFIDVCRMSNMNRRTIYKWLKDFCKYYKEKALDLEYYREFTREALFRIKGLGDDDTMTELVTDDLLDNLDISYNYLHIIIPLLQIII